MNIRSRVDDLLDQVRNAVVQAIGNVPLSVRLAAMMFSSKRSDYYRYLADLIEGTQGQKGIRSIFEDDAERYDRKSRGTLSKHWLAMFDKHGGKLARTFEGTLPDEEVQLLHMLQSKGGEGVFEEGLRELAASTALTTRAFGIVLGAIAAVAIPVIIIVAMCIAMPMFTVPEIKSGFSLVPPALYPQKAKDLFALSDFIANNGLLLAIAMVATIWGVAWSLPRLRGPARPFFDKYLLAWGIYRDFQGIKFISSLSLVLKARNNESSRLIDALKMQYLGASPWKTSIIKTMVKQVDAGRPVQEVFKAGLFEEEMQFDLEDLIKSRGLNNALVFLQPRLEERVVKKLQRRATLMKVTLYVLSGAACTYLLILHTLATSALQQTMQLNLN